MERPLVATNRIAMMEHKHLQVVRDGSSKLVAVDAVGCIPGDWVICVGSSAARDNAEDDGVLKLEIGDAVDLLADIDPALIVTPPAGMEVGDVPIATRQAIETE